jgi:hypothetical protein
MIERRERGMKSSRPESRQFPGICLDELRKITKTLSEGSRAPILDADPGLIFEEEKALSTRLRLLLLRYWLDKTGLR